jgi:hypothetical protein
VPGEQAIILLLLLLGPQTALKHRPSASPTSSSTPPSGTVTLVPAGTIIPLELKNTINSHTAYVEQAVYAKSIFPVVVDQQVLIPEGSYVRGEVTEVVRPGRVKGTAKLGLRCDSLILPDGVTRPLHARVYSIAGARLSDQSGGTPQKSDAVNTKEQSSEEPGGVAGDAIVDAGGMALGPSVTTGAEGVGGFILTLVTRGKTIILKPGTTLEIQLIDPIDLPAPSKETGEQQRQTRRRRP